MGRVSGAREGALDGEGLARWLDRVCSRSDPPPRCNCFICRKSNGRLEVAAWDAPRSTGIFPPPAPRLAPINRPQLYVDERLFEFSRRYRIVAPGREEDARVYRIRKPKILSSALSDDFERWEWLSGLRWSPSGERLDVNPGRRRGWRRGSVRWEPLSRRGMIVADHLRQGGWYIEKAGATGNSDAKKWKAEQRQEVARRLFMGQHRLDAIAKHLGLKQDTVERGLKDERDLRKQIQRGIAAELLARGYPVAEAARRTGLSERTTWNIKKKPSPPPREFSLSDFYPKHLDAYAEVLRQYVTEDQEFGEQEQAALHWLATAVYIAAWATSSAIFGFCRPNSEGEDDLASQLAARFDHQDQALHRIESTLAALVERTDETLVGLADRFPELEDEIARVRGTFELLDEDKH